VRFESDSLSGARRMRAVPWLSLVPRLNLKFQLYAIVEDDAQNGATSGFRTHEIDVAGTYAF